MMNAIIKETLLEHKALVSQGVVTVLSASISFIEQLEIYLRLAGASVALIVGILTVVKVGMDINYRRRLKKQDEAIKEKE